MPAGGCCRRRSLCYPSWGSETPRFVIGSYLQRGLITPHGDRKQQSPVDVAAVVVDSLPLTGIVSQFDSLQNSHSLLVVDGTDTNRPLELGRRLVLCAATAYLVALRLHTEVGDDGDDE